MQCCQQKILPFVNITWQFVCFDLFLQSQFFPTFFSYLLAYPMIEVGTTIPLGRGKQILRLFHSFYRCSYYELTFYPNIQLDECQRVWIDTALVKNFSKATSKGKWSFSATFWEAINHYSVLIIYRLGKQSFTDYAPANRISERSGHFIYHILWETDRQWIIFQESNCGDL